MVIFKLAYNNCEKIKNKILYYFHVGSMRAVLRWLHSPFMAVEPFCDFKKIVL